jgi:hypothetical protein
MDVLGGNIMLLVILTTLWTLPWKGWALWLAARRKEKWWFIALLVINTLALLEIFYIFVVAKQRDMHDSVGEQ